MDPKRLFPEVPDDLAAMSDDDVKALLEESEKAVELIVADDAEFLKGLTGDEVIAQLESGVETVKALREDVAAREAAFQTYADKKAELANALNDETAVEENEGEEEKTDETETAEVVAETETTEDEVAEETAEEPVLVTASAADATSSNANVSFTVTQPRYSRTPPAPAADRISVSTPEPTGTALVAAGEMGLRYTEPLNPGSLANLVIEAAVHHGPHPHIDAPGKYRFGGPEHKIARADFAFPEDRVLTGDIDGDAAKIKAVIPEGMSPGFGQFGGEALIASGGLCAPETPIYTMPNFGTEDEPVWDSLPVFQAARGGINAPAATYIGDITTAISSISEANDALGGTYATKSCQSLTCPAYTATDVQILAHCREYGNLNARAWPEKIAHENALTMQALSRTSEEFILDRIKALSVNVSNGGTGQGSAIYTVEAIVRASFGIRGRLRMPRSARFRAVMPYWVPDILVLDNISTQFDRFKNQDAIVAYLRSVGIDPVFYLDTPSTGTTQLPDSAQTAAAIDSTPANFQWAFYPEGAFLGIDSGTLELGIVRDSTLNSTNDFQVFGERFRNVALLGPAQSAYWITTTYCSAGIFPALGTARTCP